MEGSCSKAAKGLEGGACLGDGCCFPLPSLVDFAVVGQHFTYLAASKVTTNFQIQ